MRKMLTMTLLAALAALIAAPAFAGGGLETIDITGAGPSPIPGQLSAKVIGIRWDARCMPLQYRVNNTLSPVPNPLPPFTPVTTLAQATAAFQSAFDSWNNIPTSFLQFQIVGNVGNTGLRGFDMVNELTFRTSTGFAAIASSPSTSLIADTNLTHGMLLDNDADPDVFNTISVCSDADGDGDIDFPAGFYKAGTILDNDVQYNTKVSNGFRFTTAVADMDIVTRSVDLEGVAVHEDGHSLGLSHVLNNNNSATDGTGATMYPFIDTGDPAAELEQRSVDTDDIAWASYFYPEGSAASGPAALQAGDVAFDSVYGLIRGSVTHGVQNQPLAGASVSAIDRQTGREYASGFSGTTRLSFNPATGGLFFGSQAHDIVDGNYVIPVEKGNWSVMVQPVDGQPVPVTSVSFTTQIGGFYAQNNFQEEFWNLNNEAAVEKRSGEEMNVHVNPGQTNGGVDFVTNRNIVLANFGARNFIGFTGAVPGTLWAVFIPASQIAAVLPGQDILVQAAQFNTALIDASTVPMFAQALLTTGTTSGATATVDLANPLEQVSGFLAQDDDFSPFFFKNPHTLGKEVRAGIADGSIQNLVLVLQVPTTSPFPGVSARPPLIGLDGAPGPTSTEPIYGLSYQSVDGGATWSQVTTFNFMFSLVLSPAP